MEEQAATPTAPARRAATVDVAVVAYRHWELTSSCLEHLRRQTIPHRVYLCDNGCDEGTAERVRAAFPEVTVRRMERNMPYSVALNAAVTAGRGEIVVMLNNDVDAREDFLERLTAPFHSRPRLGSVAAVLLRPGERRIDSVGLSADSTLSGFPRYKNCPPEQALAVDGSGLVLTGPDGAAAAFRRLAYEQLGGLDERIAGSMDDFDFFLRLRVAGWETAAALDAVAVHVGSATYGHRSRRYRRMAGFGRAYLMRRYGVLRSPSAPRTLATEALVVLADTILSRDLCALTGRWAGWRAAAGHPARAWPPPEAIDRRLGFIGAMRLRRAIYMR
jgi:N-acetylglucosaminyl-diphospho-decaprenol L-rhamnosyltransferase